MKNGTQAEKPQAIELVIKLDRETMQVGVFGAIGDKVIAYGLLEAAKDAIRQFHEKRKPHRLDIVKAPNEFLNGLRNKFK